MTFRVRDHSQLFWMTIIFEQFVVEIYSCYDDSNGFIINYNSQSLTNNFQS